MLRDRIRGKRATLASLSAALTIAGASLSIPSAAFAAPTCEQAAAIRCYQHWPQNFPHYATMEECVEQEIAFTCPPGPPPGDGGGGVDWWYVCVSNPGFCT